MIHFTPAPWFVTLRGTSSRTWWLVPSQLKAVRRVFVTAFWKGPSMLISTYCTVGSAPTPDMTSLMCD